MAGETPGANQHHQKRRKLPWNDDRSTDKIYASGNPSALGDYRSASDAQANGVVTPTQRADDKSADKYYAVGGSNRRKITAAAGTPRPKLGPPPPRLAPATRALQPPPKPKTLTTGGLIVTDKSEVNGVLQEVIAKLQAGQAPLVLYVKAGDNNLLKRTRAALELLVTREIITEEQYHDVRLSYEPSEKAKAEIAAEIGAPAPAPVDTVSTDDNESADLDAFLSGEDVEEPVVDTAPAAVTEVDTSNDPAETKAEASIDDEDDADASSFLAPAAVTESEVPTAEEKVAADETPADEAPVAETEVEAPVEDEAPAADEAPKKKGRKSGRGA